MLDRGDTLGQYQFQMPIFDSLFFAALMRWGMMVIIIAAAIWAMFEIFKRFSLIGVGSAHKLQENTAPSE
jgi:hypothetical protein